MRRLVGLRNTTNNKREREKVKTFKYPPNQHTTQVNDELTVGEVYDYKEDSFIGEVKFMGDESNDEHYILKLQWVLHPFSVSQDTTEFQVSWTKDSNWCKYCVSGAWHLLPQGSYMWHRRPAIKKW
jgi:hypothetical protein